MDRFINDWREPTRWNADFDLDEGPAHLLPPVKLGVDALGMDEDLQPVPVTRTVVSMDPFEVAEEAGRYLPLSEAADPVEEVGSYLPFAGPVHEVESDLPSLDFSPRNRLQDPALDEFFVEARFGDAHGHGRFGVDPRKVDLIDHGSDVATASPASDADEDSSEVFISLPDGETASVVPLGDGMEDFGFNGLDAAFGGGDDPYWMLTLLPSPDGHDDDAWFGHPGPSIDPWG